LYNKKSWKYFEYSSDKPDNYFLSLSLKEDAIFITGDKLALEFAKKIILKQPPQVIL